MKKTRVILSSDAEKVYKRLKKDSKEERMILDRFHDKVSLIKQDIHHGNPINKRLIPAMYKKKYGIKNLFRVELPQFWRFVYTLTDGENKEEIIIFILDIFDHKTYNRIFSYR